MLSWGEEGEQRQSDENCVLFVSGMIWPNLERNDYQPDFVYYDISPHPIWS